MRVQFGKRIYFCTLATKSGSHLILTTNNGIYTVSCGSLGKAEFCYEHLLKTGWYDFSEFDYSN